MAFNPVPYNLPLPDQFPTITMDGDYTKGIVPIVVDAETFYEDAKSAEDPDDPFSIKTYPANSYIQDRRFVVHNFSIHRIGIDKTPILLEGYQFIEWFKQNIDPSKVLFVGANGTFDAGIIEYFIPGYKFHWFAEIQSMVAKAYGTYVKAYCTSQPNSLDSITRVLKIRSGLFGDTAKLKQTYKQFIGQKFLPPDIQTAVNKLVMVDVDLTRQVFELCLPKCTDKVLWSMTKYATGFLANPIRYTLPELDVALDKYHESIKSDFDDFNTLMTQHPNHPIHYLVQCMNTRDHAWLVEEGIRRTETQEWVGDLGDIQGVPVENLEAVQALGKHPFESFGAACKGTSVSAKRLRSSNGRVDQNWVRSRSFAVSLYLLCGVELVEGITPTGKKSFKIDKKTPEFLELTAHEDPIIAAFTELQLVYKSSIMLSRLEGMRRIGVHPQGAGFDIKVHTAHNTGRCTGAGGLNPQNMPKKGGVREAIRCHPGMKITSPDLSGIELRMGLYIAGDWERLERIRLGKDIYIDMAVSLYPEYSYEWIEKHNDDINSPDHERASNMRSHGKVAMLLFIYQGGERTFIRTSFTWGVRDLTIKQGARFKKIFRDKFPLIKAQWAYFQKWIIRMYQAQQNGTTFCIEHPFVKGLMLHDQGIDLPDGYPLRYPGLHKHSDGSYTYLKHKVPQNLYGGTVFQSVNQGNSASVFEWNTNIIFRNIGSHVVGSVHDELPVVAYEDTIEDMLEYLIVTMTLDTPMAPGLPLKAEGHYGDSFADCK